MTLTIDFGFHLCLSNGSKERHYALPLVKRVLTFNRLATWAKAASVVTTSIIWGLR